MNRGRVQRHGRNRRSYTSDELSATYVGHFLPLSCWRILGPDFAGEEKRCTPDLTDAAASAASRTPGGASRRRRGRCRARSRVPRVLCHTRASSTRRSRQPL